MAAGHHKKLLANLIKQNVVTINDGAAPSGYAGSQRRGFGAINQVNNAGAGTQRVNVKGQGIVISADWCGIYQQREAGGLEVRKSDKRQAEKSYCQITTFLAAIHHGDVRSRLL